jgi:hypothetical protein
MEPLELVDATNERSEDVRTPVGAITQTGNGGMR